MTKPCQRLSIQKVILETRVVNEFSNGSDQSKTFIRSSIFIAPSKVVSNFPFLSYMAR